MERKHFSRAPDFDLKAEQHSACLAGSGAAYSISSKQATIQRLLPYLEKGGVRYFSLPEGFAKQTFPQAGPTFQG